MPKSLIVNAFGPSGPQPPMVEFFDDFITTGTSAKFGAADVADWLFTTENSGTVLGLDATPDGAVRLLCGAAANDFSSIQLNGESFALNANRKIYFRTRIRTNDSDDIKFFCGLASTDVTGTTLGPILDGVNNSIGFRNVLGNTTAFLSVTEDDTTETTNAASVMADNTWIELSFIVNGTSSVEFYVNDALTATHYTNLPDSGDALTLTFEVCATTASDRLDIDYVYVGVTGPRAS
jgi:hypothetical protein